MSGFAGPGTQLYPFAFPGQSIGQWANFDPTAGPFTFVVNPGFAISYLWFPTLSDGVKVYAGTTTVGALPFRTTGTSGFEGVPCPAGTLSVTLQSVDGAGAIMPVYITSLTFDPIIGGFATPAVNTVTATAPITSTGGANPLIALTTPLAVAFGGTGTITPSLVAGTGIVITGTWPNQTIATTGGSAPVTSVGASSPLASTGGTTPTISLSGIVPVANGGTGTATPALVAGTGITITGTFPAQTIAATAVPVGTTVVTMTTFTSPATTLPITLVFSSALTGGSGANWFVEAYVSGLDFGGSSGNATLTGGGAGVSWASTDFIQLSSYARFMIIAGNSPGGDTPSATLSATGSVILVPTLAAAIFVLKATRTV